jgi:hypothetical protein
LSTTASVTSVQGCNVNGNGMLVISYTCPVGTYSSAGSSSCTACPAGF